MIAFIVILIMCSPIILGIVYGPEVKVCLDTNPPLTNEQIGYKIQQFGYWLRGSLIHLLTWPLRKLGL
jgi:hypothetical protein